MRKRIELGDECSDPVSGLVGIAICRHQYLQGCDRISLQQPMQKDGTMFETVAFDEPQLEVVKRSVVKPASTAQTQSSGGPHWCKDTPKL